MVSIRKLGYIVGIFCFLIVIIPNVTYGHGVFFHRGSQGPMVTQIQIYLQRLDYLRQRPSGFYGKITAEAVKSFQLEHGLQADGIVGPITMAAFQAAVNGDNPPVPVRDTLTRIASRGRAGGIKPIGWSTVNLLWKDGETASIIDVETGKIFRARRLYGYYHADVEPLTKQDTDVMLSIYGGNWSWNRRSVVVYMQNLWIAASINGMPHGNKTISGNGFPGQFCVHFLGSRVHQSGMIDPEHLAMIEKAAACDFSFLSRKSDTDPVTPIYLTGFNNHQDPIIEENSPF